MKALEIVWTSQFKKDYKLAMKRHLDLALIDEIIRTLSRGESLPSKTKIMLCLVDGAAIASAIFSRIGCLFIGLSTMCLC